MSKKTLRDLQEAIENTETVASISVRITLKKSRKTDQESEKTHEAESRGSQGGRGVIPSRRYNSTDNKNDKRYFYGVYDQREQKELVSQI